MSLQQDNSYQQVRLAVQATVTRLQGTIKPAPGVNPFGESQQEVGYLAAALLKSWADPILHFLTTFRTCAQVKNTCLDFKLDLQLQSWHLEELHLTAAQDSRVRLQQLARLLVCLGLEAGVNNQSIILI